VVEVVVRDSTVDEFHRGDLDDAMAECWIETGSFGVEDDLSHGLGNRQA
jgi:hypothetical protein